ncbi:DUF4302 domain-containing protein [Capnocytophaga sputigena]|jgi:hypothetical protein|uniref:DUF4302 domain-containing protein n=1 Tax=Capnocytophaga sputigena TaxID=1019 RepID=UPI000BB57E2B|nr:DUF4302 domain-containing protein [Capnocytophaga sputigena]PBN47887.1 hypothetical protein CDC50_04765 [Capnocytophaga sputigena]
MKRLLLLPIIALALFACQKNEPDDLFGGKNPSQRFQQNQAELRQELTSPEQGWKFVYYTNDKKFGGFIILMKFTPEGLVTMNSDIGATTSSTTSKYEIKWGQGALLSFTTKNHIHELSDSTKGETGVGYEGNFEFIYFGKEGNKLKFKTQRSDTEQFVYFEPATAQDWNTIQTLSSNVKTLEDNIDNYYFTVSTTASSTGYEVNFANRFITVTSLDGSSTQKASVYATETGIGFKPALTFEGKTFTGLTRDNSTTPPTYKTTVDGVTAQMTYSLVPPEAFINDDYKDMENIRLFLIDPAPFRKGTSDSFYNDILKVDDSKEWFVFRVSLQTNGKCQIQVAYEFETNKPSYYLVSTTYELKNKRLYISDNVLSSGYSNAVWNNAENAAIKARATVTAAKFLEIASDGLYIKKTSRLYAGTYIIYTIQSHNHPTYYSEGATVRR